MAESRRLYDQACGVAHSLDIVGDRWALLIVRELLLGAKRFADLRSGLNGISANVLSQRLDELENNGVLAKITLPPPVSVSIYELTEWGYRAEPIIQALSMWGITSRTFDPTKRMTQTSLVLSFRALLDRGRLDDGERGRVGFRFASEQFTVEYDRQGVVVERGSPMNADVLFEGGVREIADVVYFGAALMSVKVEGDVDLAKRFVELLDFPAAHGA